MNSSIKLLFLTVAMIQFSGQMAFAWGIDIPGVVNIKGDDPQIVKDVANTVQQVAQDVNREVGIAAGDVVRELNRGGENIASEGSIFVNSIARELHIGVANMGKEADIFLKNASREVGQVYAANIGTMVVLGRINACMFTVCFSEVERSRLLKKEEEEWSNLAREQAELAKSQIGEERIVTLRGERDLRFNAYLRAGSSILLNIRPVKSKEVLSRLITKQLSVRAQYEELDAGFSKKINDETLPVAQSLMNHPDRESSESIEDSLQTQMDRISKETRRDIVMVYANFLTNLDKEKLRWLKSVTDSSLRRWKKEVMDAQLRRQSLKAEILHLDQVINSEAK